jgi:hypothetical protein
MGFCIAGQIIQRNDLFQARIQPAPQPTICRKLTLALTIQLHILNNVLTGYRFPDHSASTEEGGSLSHTANISHVKHK